VFENVWCKNQNPHQGKKILRADSGGGGGGGREREREKNKRM